MLGLRTRLNDSCELFKGNTGASVTQQCQAFQMFIEKTPSFMGDSLFLKRNSMKNKKFSVNQDVTT